MYELLIEQLRICSCTSTCETCPYVYEHCEDNLIKNAADAIEELSSAGSIYGKAWTLGYDAGRDENMPRWIPVTERLPEIGEKVLVFAYSNDTFTARMCEQTEDGYPVFECDGIFLETAKPGRITHWMPLPQPPEQKEKS